LGEKANHIDKQKRQDDNRDGADSLGMMLWVMGNETRTATGASLKSIS